MGIRGNDIVALVTGGALESYYAPPPRGDMESIMMENSPSSVLALYITDTTLLLTTPDEKDDWPLYISSMPDGDNIEDDCAAVYDTAGTLDGRIMASGQVIQHFGIQIRVRCLDYEEGWKKAEDIAIALDGVDNVEVIKNETTYTLLSLSRTSPVVPLGLETGTKRRYLFTVNFVLSIREEV